MSGASLYPGSVTETLVAGLRANSCVVSAPLSADDARDVIVDRVATGGLVACNADVPVPGLVAALRERGVELLEPDSGAWSERLASAEFGITGARLAVAEPPAIALVAAPGAPRATSLVPPTHICVLRAADVLPTLADAMARFAAGDMPSALTWIGGPSRTGDLEMITTLGVHGPRAVDVVLLA